MLSDSSVNRMNPISADYSLLNLSISVSILKGLVDFSQGETIAVLASACEAFGKSEYLSPREVCHYEWFKLKYITLTLFIPQ